MRQKQKGKVRGKGNVFERAAGGVPQLVGKAHLRVEM